MAELDGFQDAKKEGRKKSTRLCVSISSDVFDKFKEHVEDAGYDTSKLVEKILSIYLNKVESKETVKK